jgi:hypothetical protein
VQRQIKVCQWLIPGLTGAVEVLNALHGEQQQPNRQVTGIFEKPMQVVDSLS